MSGPAPRGRRTGLLALLVALAIGPGAPLHTRANADEAALKAAIAYNLMLFTQWPDETAWSVGAPLVLCADPGSRWWPALRQLQDRPVRQARLQVREPGRSADGWRACHVLLLDGALQGAVAAAGQLPIADEGEGTRGWVIRLGRQGERLVFDIDLQAARTLRLQVSSKALRLAREVRE